MISTYILTRDLNPTSAISFGGATFAGIVATVAITITLAFTGTNILQALGGMMLGTDANVIAQYVVGGAVHFLIGVVYGVMYAVFFDPVSEWTRITKGVIVGLATTALALALIPLIALALGAVAAEGGGSPFDASINLFNHLVFGVVVAFTYRPTVL